MIAGIEQDWGGVDILVNNAGISQNLPLALMEEEDWDRVMDVNVKGVFLTSRAALRGMIRRKRGVVLNIGSLVGVRMMEAPVHYCASKAAVKGSPRRWRKRSRATGSASSASRRGCSTMAWDESSRHRLADYLKHCSLGRLGSLDGVARFAAFLVSDANSYMSGETLVIDGGL